MDYDLFRKIIDENKKSVELVLPFAGGEPLMYPHIFDVIAYCKRAGIKTELSTNATLLTREMSLRLLSSGLDCLILAFDGATPDVYETYRKGARFEKVRENILEFLKLKLEMKSKMQVVLQMVLLRDNCHQIEAFEKLWRVPGVDAIRFKEDFLKYPSVTTQENELATQTKQKAKHSPCFLLWRGPIYIRYDGTVVPCCLYTESAGFGDLKRQTFKEVWNSEKMQALRRAHVRGDLSEYPACARCTIPQPKPVFACFSFLVNSLFLAKVLPVFEKLNHFYKLPIFKR
jgi:radical SAM protein with 4Fe4S-binding SPASM domain